MTDQTSSLIQVCKFLDILFQSYECYVWQDVYINVSVFLHSTWKFFQQLSFLVSSSIRKSYGQGHATWYSHVFILLTLTYSLLKSSQTFTMFLHGTQNVVTSKLWWKYGGTFTILIHLSVHFITWMSWLFTEIA